MSKLEGCIFRKLYRNLHFVTFKILQIWAQLKRLHFKPFLLFLSFPCGMMNCDTRQILVTATVPQTDCHVYQRKC